jgi:hypothetical protein
VDPQTNEALPASTLAQHLPKIWIGYLLCLATFIDEAIFVTNHPELVSKQLFVVPPLHLFMLGFVSFVYWLVRFTRYTLCFHWFRAGTIRFRLLGRFGSTSFPSTTSIGSISGRGSAPIL